MSISFSRSIARCLSAAAVVCAMVSAAAPAQAAVIGSFDPAFSGSGPLQDLGFRGTFALDVSSGCYADGPGYVSSGYGGCQITMDSLEIIFYDTQTNQTLQTVDLASSFFSPYYVTGAYFDPQSNQLVGFDSNDSGEFSVSVSDSNVNYSGDMLIYFVSGYGGGIDPAYLVDCNSASQPLSLSVQSVAPSCTRYNSNNSNPATVTITSVPEPATIPLALLGLTALAIARRRNTSVRSALAR